MSLQFIHTHIYIYIPIHTYHTIPFHFITYICTYVYIDMYNMVVSINGVTPTSSILIPVPPRATSCQRPQRWQALKAAPKLTLLGCRSATDGVTWSNWIEKLQAQYKYFNICISISTFISVYIFKCIYMYIYIYVYVHIYIYLHIFIYM